MEIYSRMILTSPLGLTVPVHATCLCGSHEHVTRPARICSIESLCCLKPFGLDVLGCPSPDVDLRNRIQRSSVASTISGELHRPQVRSRWLRGTNALSEFFLRHVVSLSSVWIGLIAQAIDLVENALKYGHIFISHD